MKGRNLLTSPDYNTENEFSKDNIIKIILQCLVERYSLKNVIYDLITVTRKKESELKLNDKIPLNCEDILSIIYQNCGVIKLYNCFLEINNIYEEKTSKNDISRLPKKRGKKEKYISLRERNYLSTPLSLLDEDELLSNKDNENKIKEEIISLNENESTVYQIREGKKTELKKRKRKEKIRKSKKFEDVKPDYIHNGVSSESKLVNVSKKLGDKIGDNLSFHYVLEEGKMYKFKLKEVNEQKEIAKFICDDPKCLASAKYSISNKLFKTLKKHTILAEEHEYNKNMILTDINILNHMKVQGIEDLQLTKE
jgi:hypothetical protein